MSWTLDFWSPHKGHRHNLFYVDSSAVKSKMVFILTFVLSKYENDVKMGFSNKLELGWQRFQNINEENIMFDISD